MNVHHGKSGKHPLWYLWWYLVIKYMLENYHPLIIWFIAEVHSTMTSQNRNFLGENFSSLGNFLKGETQQFAVDVCCFVFILFIAISAFPHCKVHYELSTIWCYKKGHCWRILVIVSFYNYFCWDKLISNQNLSLVQTNRSVLYITRK